MKQKIGVFLAWVLLLGGLLAAYLLTGGNIRNSSPWKEDIRISFLKTQNDADAIIIYSGNRGILIDAGETADGKMIVEEINDRGITAIDYMILTHPDKDHIGGAKEILQKIPTEKVVQSYYTEEKEELTELNNYCKENQIPIFYPAHTWRINTDYVQFIVYPPLEKHYKEANNYSLAVLAKHGEVNMLFTGDALRKRTEELMSMHLPKIDLYKVPHHGRANKTTEKILEDISPDFAVVTSDTADREVVESCQKLKTELFFTGKDSITFISDGMTVRPEG